MEKKIIGIIAKGLGRDEKTITLNTRLVEDLSADSLDVAEMIINFEDEFKISISDEDVPTMKTVGDIVEYIKAKTKKK